MTEELEYKYVLGQDPGGTTGIALLRYTDTTPPELVYLHQIGDGMRGFHEFFVGSAVSEHLTYVSEKWVERNIKGSDHTPAYIEGVQYAFWQDEVEYQEPKMKKLISDDFLRENNLWTPGKRHQMDALIHALVYLRNQGHEPTLEALSGESEQKLAEEGEAEQKQLDGEQFVDPETDALAEALASLAEAMEDAQEAAAAIGEGTEEADGEPVGSADNEAQDFDNNRHIGDVEVKGTRKRRERNGVFAGYEADTQGVEKELYVD